MIDVMHAALLTAMFVLGCVAAYMLGRSSGYRRARCNYVPLLVNSERDHTEIIDRLSVLTTGVGDHSAYEGEREWEAKLAEMGCEVPEERPYWPKGEVDEEGDR